MKGFLIHTGKTQLAIRHYVNRAKLVGWIAINDYPAGWEERDLDKLI